MEKKKDKIDFIFISALKIKGFMSFRAHRHSEWRSREESFKKSNGKILRRYAPQYDKISVILSVSEESCEGSYQKRRERLFTSFRVTVRPNVILSDSEESF